MRTFLRRAAAFFVFLLTGASPLFAQEIPDGIALPISLRQTLDVRKAKPGQVILAEIAQTVPLPDGRRIRARSPLNGRVIDAGVRSDGTSYVQLTFERVRVNQREVPVMTSLRALASWWAVRDAQLPSRGPTRGESPESWTTVQVGGDVVYRGGGHVMRGDTVVGEPAYKGVMSQLTCVPVPGCADDSVGRKQALWVFSSSACDVYGFDDLKISQPGRDGRIVLQSKKNFRLQAGSGLLLVTTSSMH